MKPKPQNQKQLKAHQLRKYLVAMVLLLICLLSLLSLWFINTPPQNLQTGLLSTSQTHTGEVLHNSLDLSLAAKAQYPSSALSVAQNLGVEGGIKEQVVRFGVPVDGLNEYGLLMLPTAAAPAKGYPVIILLHGYFKPADYSTVASYISDMEFYARNGFAVIKPDLRGQGLSAGQGVATSAYYSMDYNTDVMSLISALKDTSYIDKTNINLWGHSMGAYLALRASVLSKDIKNTILLSGPVGSLKQLYLSYVPPSDENNPQALKVRSSVFVKYGTPGENAVFWKNASPSNFLNQSNCVYQIHVGQLDGVVPPELSSDLDSQLSDLHRTHEYYVYADGRHSLAAQRPQIWARSLALLRKTD
jgi:dipeptidyl aminopeptidase/acylaminoacyl peptidase